jgi:hypothetical protein
LSENAGLLEDPAIIFPQLSLPKKISFESRNLFGAKYGTNFNELEGNS